jgi:hypothetical protein
VGWGSGPLQFAAMSEQTERIQRLSERATAAKEFL